MKTILLLTIALTALGSHAKSLKECERYVRDNLSTFAICYPHATAKTDSMYRFDVYSCKKTRRNITCTVSQDFPSSACEQEIYLDKRCQFNSGAKITRDEREDF